MKNFVAFEPSWSAKLIKCKLQSSKCYWTKINWHLKRLIWSKINYKMTNAKQSEHKGYWNDCTFFQIVSIIVMIQTRFMQNNPFYNLVPLLFSSMFLTFKRFINNLEKKYKKNIFNMKKTWIMHFHSTPYSFFCSFFCLQHFLHQQKWKNLMNLHLVLI